MLQHDERSRLDMICFPSLYEHHLHQHDPSTSYIIIQHLPASRDRSSSMERTRRFTSPQQYLQASVYHISHTPTVLYHTTSSNTNTSIVPSSSVHAQFLKELAKIRDCLTYLIGHFFLKTISRATDCSVIFFKYLHFSHPPYFHTVRKILPWISPIFLLPPSSWAVRN